MQRRFNLSMSRRNYAVRTVTVLLFTILVLAVFALFVAAQDDSWQLLRADYGWRQQRTDVTDLLRDLLSRGKVNGRVAVNNQTMGGDPAVGRDKTLRVFARNFRGEERQFEFVEGSSIEAGMFRARRESDWDDRPRGDRDRDKDRGDLQILYAFYGVQRRTVNVTDLLRSRVREGSLLLPVDNRSLGGDPAVGADKVLIVIYRYEGMEQAAAVGEGNTLSLP
jgi:hypothetical protein